MSLCFRSRLFLVVLGLALFAGRSLAADKLVSPNASPEAQRLRAYLDEIKGQYILSGQHENVDWFGINNEAEMDYLKAQTGKLPVVRGFDYIFYVDALDWSTKEPMQHIAERAIAWHQQHGVVTINWHWFVDTIYNGKAYGAFYNEVEVTETNGTKSKIATNFEPNNIFVEGTREQSEFYRELDQIAGDLKKLRDAGVPVIWRPFHECSGGWFWWGTRGATTFKKLWSAMFTRLTQYHGLNNLIWCYNPTERDTNPRDWYPGDAYVDMVSFDFYPTKGTHPTFQANYQQLQQLVGTSKPIALSEVGSIPDIDQMFAEGANWTWFAVWNGSFITDGVYNSVPFLQTVYNHARVLTLDEMPDLYRLLVTVPPTTAKVVVGEPATFSITAKGATAYVWQRSLDGGLTWTDLTDDATYTGTTTPTLTVADCTLAMWGQLYRCGITDGVQPTLYSSAAALQPKYSQFAALSARAPVGTGDQTLILGFVFAGGGKPTMLRGVGPGLLKGDASLAGKELADPQLILNELQTVNSASQFVPIATNDNWGGTAELRTTMSALGMGALDDTSKDAALLHTPTQVVYTAQVSGVGDTTGVALAEAYDAHLADKTKRLTALSLRNQVGAGANNLFAGFVISGDLPKKVVIRGVGPGLVPTVPAAQVLANPLLQLNRFTPATLSWTVVGTNDDWGGSAALTATMKSLGMGALAADSKDAVLALELQPGIYTAQLGGVGDTTGVGLVEIYESSSLAPLAWTSTGPLISPITDAQHPIVSVKDPTVVYDNGKWHVYATTADTNGNWNMVYLNFRTWAEAATAQPYYLNQNPNLAGYHCAPQVFYFRPQKKWYLLYQSQHPTFSTTDDLAKPETWTAPQAFFQGTPASVVQGWIDYWIICDDTHAYLFFSDDNGRFYRSRTKLEDFPRNFGDPEVIMQETNKFDLFEASCVYRLQGLNQYLCFIECLGQYGRRYFKAFTTDRLDGTWKPLAGANTWETPFAGLNNVAAAAGGTLWTVDISHGELLRVGSDETMTVDPQNLHFLYQGMDRNASAPSYNLLPYRLALLSATNAAQSADLPPGGN